MRFLKKILLSAILLTSFNSQAITVNPFAFNDPGANAIFSWNYISPNTGKVVALTLGANCSITGTVFNCSGGGGGGGTVTSITAAAPLTGGTITTSGTIGITQATTSTDGYLSSSDWNSFNGKLSSVTTDTTLTGAGTGGFPLGINLTHANTWTANQTFNNNVTLGSGSDINFNTTGQMQGEFNVLGSTTFHGGGKNNLHFAGTYTGVATPTYTYTINFLDGRIFTVDDSSGFVVGDSVLGNDTGATGTILYIDTQGNINVQVTSGNFSGESLLIDSDNSFSSPVESLGISDLGTFTDGTTTLNYTSLEFPETLNGITYAVTGSNRFRLHTIGNFWDASVAASLSTVMSMDFSAGAYKWGDVLNALQGNRYETTLSGGHSVFEFKDKLGTYFSVNKNTNQIGSSLLAGSNDNFAGLDASGNFSSVSNPASIGAHIPGATGNYVLQTNVSGNLTENLFGARIFADSANLDILTDAFNISNLNNNLFYQFDMSLSGTGRIQFGDLGGAFGTGLNQDMRLTSGEWHNQTPNIYTVEDPSSNPFLSLDIFDKIYGLGDLFGSFNGTSIVITDGSNLITFNSSTGTYTYNNLPDYPNDAAAITAGLTSGRVYENTTAIPGTTLFCVVP